MNCDRDEVYFDEDGNDIYEGDFGTDFDGEIEEWIAEQMERDD